MSETVLSVANLRAETVDGLSLIRDIGFSVRRGETLALLGESGSGKTLTAMSVMRLLPDAIRLRAGSVHFEGRDLLALSERQMCDVRGGSIACIFQEPMTAMNPVKTVGDQVLEAVRLNCGLRSARARRHRVLNLFERVGLDAERVFEASPHELSGGMRQRAMIAMALAGEPELLIADEPTTALDVTTEAQVLELIKSLQRKMGMTMLFISHDLSVISNVADEVIVMRDGEIVDQGVMRGFFGEQGDQRHEYSMQLRRAIPGLNTRGQHLSAHAPDDKLLGDASDANGAAAISSPRDASPAQRSAEAAAEASAASSHDSLPDSPPDSLPDSPPLLRVEELKMEFLIRGGVLKRVRDRVRAVNEVSFDLHRGRTLALVGESGSGKTSVANAILRLVEATSGRVLFDGVNALSLSGEQLKAYRRRVQVVFQDPFSSLNPKRTIGRTLTEGMETQGLGNDADAMRERAIQLLHSVGLEADAMLRYPHEFSGGQRQRICIARALSVSPTLVICDEPTSALDVLVQAQILDLFSSMQRRLGLSYLFISHDLSAVAHIADDIAVMHKGRIVERGPTNRVLREPQSEYTQSLLAAAPKFKEH